MSDDVIEIHPTNIVMLPATQETMREVLAAPNRCLELLERYAGNISLFLSQFSTNAEERQMILYQAESTMRKDAKQYALWKAAIKRSHTTRLQLLKCDALDKLERYQKFYPPKKDDDLGMIKQTDDIAFAKCVMGDLLAGQIAQEKSLKPKPGGAIGKEDNHDEDDEDDEALERASEGLQ